MRASTIQVNRNLNGFSTTNGSSVEFSRFPMILIHTYICTIIIIVASFKDVTYRILSYNILYYILYHIILNYIILYDMILYYIILYYIIYYIIYYISYMHVCNVNEMIL